MYAVLAPDLSCRLQRFLVFVGDAHDDAHLDEAGDGHERRDGADEQRQLPRVDEADDEAGDDARRRLEHHAQPHTRRLQHDTDTLGFILRFLSHQTTTHSLDACFSALCDG